MGMEAIIWEMIYGRKIGKETQEYSVLGGQNVEDKKDQKISIRIYAVPAPEVSRIETAQYSPN